MTPRRDAAWRQRSGVGSATASTTAESVAPPADVAGPLVEIAVHDLDAVQRQVGEAGATVAVDHTRNACAEAIELLDLAVEVRLQFARHLLDRRRDFLDLARHHREAATGFAGPRRLDQRVQGQDPGAVGDVLDGCDAGRDGLRDRGRQIDDQGG